MISHRVVHLRALQRMAEKAEDRRNMVLAAQLHGRRQRKWAMLSPITRELTGKDGKDFPAAVAPVTIFQFPDNGRG